MVSSVPQNQSLKSTASLKWSFVAQVSQGVLSALPWSDRFYQNFVPSDYYTAFIPASNKNVSADFPSNKDVALPEIGFLHDGSSYGSYDHDQNLEAWNMVELQTSQFLSGYDGQLQQSPSVLSAPNLGLGEHEVAVPDYDGSSDHMRAYLAVEATAVAVTD
jgi:hypothetical protein